MPDEFEALSHDEVERRLVLIREQVADLFVAGPLYKRLDVELGGHWARHDLPAYPPSVQYYCNLCKTTTTHMLHLIDPRTARPIDEERLSLRYIGLYLFVPYRCGVCGQHEFVVLVKFVPTKTMDGITPSGQSYAKAGYYMKIGQWPPFSKAASPEIRSALSKEHVELYEKGLMNLSASYGLGAVVYFRRIVEDTIEELLDLVQEAATENGDKAAIAEIEKARRQKRTDVRLQLISNVVPPVLKQGGGNPLKVLHDEYSDDLHGRSEQEAVESATRLRAAFELTFRLLKSHKIDLAELRKLMSKGRGS